MAMAMAMAKANLVVILLEEEILPRCPAKSLLRFKLVSKSFNALISSPRLIELHLRHCNVNPILILNYARLSGSPSRICFTELHSSESPLSSVVSLPIPRFLGLNRSSNRSNIVGSCHGLLCLEGTDYRFVVLNPCTAKYVEIPCFYDFYVDRRHRYVVSSMNFGFGFDSLGNDYKVVVVVDCTIIVVDNHLPNDGANISVVTREVFVYSLKAKSWELVEGTSYEGGLLGNGCGVSLNNHLLHWIIRFPENNRIGCFDLRINQWVQDVPLPDCCKNNRLDIKFMAGQIGVLDKCLCLITWGPREMWIMKEYGNKASWVKVLGVLDSQITESLRSHPPAFHGDELLVRRVNRKKRVRELVICNIREKTFQKVDQIFKSRKTAHYFVDARICDATLVDLPGAKNLHEIVI